MLTLFFFWLLLGFIIGMLANAARLLSQTWNRWRWGWLILPVIGAIAALVGGWIGVLLIGRYFATGCALGVAVGGTIVASRLISRLISAETHLANT